MSIMNRLQSMNINKLDLDEAVELSTLAKSLREGYERHQLSSPMILDDSIRQLDRYIGDQIRDRTEMELREIAQADATDMTAPERRAARAARREELEARLTKNRTPEAPKV